MLEVSLLPFADRAPAVIGRRQQSAESWRKRLLPIEGKSGKLVQCLEKPMTALTLTPSWQALAAHHAQVKDVHLRTLFADDPGRAKRFSAEGAGLFLDYSKNRITDETLRLLLRLADERGVAKRRDAMFAGEKINVTEHRAVMHMALRAPRGVRMEVDGADVVPAVHEVLDAMAHLAARFAGALSSAIPAKVSATWSISGSADPISGRKWPIAPYAISATAR